MSQVKKPCIGCKYYKACGSSTRTEPCAGRITKRDDTSSNKEVPRND